MNPDNGVLGLDRLSAHVPAISARVVCLGEPVVLGAETFEQSLDWLREALVRNDLRGPASVATSGGERQQSQESDAWGLVLVRHVGVIARGREPVVTLP